MNAIIQMQDLVQRVKSYLLEFDVVQAKLTGP